MPPQPKPFFPAPLRDEGFVINPKLAAKGLQLYGKCAICHGANVEAKGMAPDLRASPLVLSREAFVMVVREGVKMSMGMPVFNDLTDDDLTALRHFIRQKARQKTPAMGTRESS